MRWLTNTRLGQRLDADWPIIFPAIVMAAMGTFRLGRQSVWLDEASTWWVARLPTSVFIPAITTSFGGTPLYYVIARGWLVFGESEAVLRSLSVVFSVAAVATAALVARRLAGPGAALLAGVLMAVNPFVLHYAQEARPYAVQIFLVTASSLLFLWALDGGGNRRWFAYVAVTVLAVYCQALAILVVPAHALSLLFWPRGGRGFLSPSAAFVAVGILVSPLLLSLNGAGQAVSWIPAFHVSQVRLAFLEFAGGWPGLGLLGLASAAALASLVRLSSRDQRRDRFALLFLASWAITPTVVLSVVSTKVPLMQARYLITSVPPLLILAGIGISRLQARLLVAAAAVALLAAFLVVDYDWYSAEHKQNWRGAVELVRTQSLAGDLVVTEDAGRIPLDYYRQVGPGWDHDVDQIEAPVRPEGVQPYRRVWVFKTGPEGGSNASMETWLSVNSLMVQDHRFFGVETVLYALR